MIRLFHGLNSTTPKSECFALAETEVNGRADITIDSLRNAT